MIGDRSGMSMGSSGVFDGDRGGEECEKEREKKGKVGRKGERWIRYRRV